MVAGGLVPRGISRCHTLFTPMVQCTPSSSNKRRASNVSIRDQPPCISEAVDNALASLRFDLGNPHRRGPNAIEGGNSLLFFPIFGSQTRTLGSLPAGNRF